MEDSATEGGKYTKETLGLALLFVGLFFCLSIFSFDPRDPSFNQAVTAGYKVKNLAGTTGSYLSGFLVALFGRGAVFFPLFFLVPALGRFRESFQYKTSRKIGLTGLFLCFLSWANHPWFFTPVADLYGFIGGGYIGRMLTGGTVSTLSATGSALLWFFFTLIFLQLTLSKSWPDILKSIAVGAMVVYGVVLEWILDTKDKYQSGGEREDGDKVKKTTKKDFSGVNVRINTNKKGSSVDAKPSSPKESFSVSAYVERVKTFWYDLVEELWPEPEEYDGAYEDDVEDILEAAEKKNPTNARQAAKTTKAQKSQPKASQPLASSVSNAASPHAGTETVVDVVDDVVVVDGIAVTIDKNRSYDDPKEVVDRDELLKPFTPEAPKKTAKKAKKKFPAANTPLPSLDFLIEPQPQEDATSHDRLMEQAGRLAECLADFNVQGEIQDVTPGPVVTMFEFKPAPGVKVSKIAGLSDDIAMALRAMAVRIEAPIPGKDTVGIEIPNDQRQIVYLRELFESKVFKKAKSPVTLALGKDIGGAGHVADLAKMPHLLIAGATGKGKSVCLNGILLSILYKASPEEVKLLLVDPKRIELAVYADLPHLVHPVVTEMELAKSALEWAVYEMDKRYKAIARMGVRNIDAYNDKLKKFGNGIPEDMADLEYMPYLVIVIDELADLMMTAAKEVEMSIVRLAQLARAAGIHLIIATQRPSVDVVTGLIKANFPTRISFQVTSKHDSRTILDAVGAEHLLGMGDMLFKPSGDRTMRMHGAFVDVPEIEQVVEFWKNRVPQNFELDFSSWRDPSGGSASGGRGENSDDPVYDEAVDFVVQQGKASISLIQRKFRIGFNKAARYVEQMEDEGIVGPQDGSKPRVVLAPKQDYPE
ncbi:MAG: DNA translocase FtsK [Desulfovibrio sp.]